MVRWRVFFLAKNIWLVIIDTTLISWAALISSFFFIFSLFELLKGNNSCLFIYFLALVILTLHFLISRKFPERFIRESKRVLLSSEKTEEMITGVFLKIFAALASSVAIFTLFWPEKIDFFINNWQALTEEIAFSFFVSIVLSVIFLIILPLGIAFLIVGIIPDFSTKERKKYLTFSLYMIFILLFYLYVTVQDLMDKPTILELLTTRILQEKSVVDLIRFTLGVPLLFWLEYLFLGISWLKIKQ